MDQYLIYLRKSRQDRDLELQTGSYDTLERHRKELLALAKDRGYTIAGILEEVVTGDTIAERPKMQELLRLVESGDYTGVLVVEVPRLARGKTRDQGIVSETFQYSGTKIITPERIYDPANDADADYFEFGLFMSRQEYRTINKRLNRGRMASLNEGKYIAGTAPYGYEKYKLPKQKGYTLRIVEDQAAVVRRIYQMYVDGVPGPNGTNIPLGSFRIANQLNAEGLLSPGGGKWTATAVRDILKNPVYIGLLRWSYRPVIKKVIDGNAEHSTPISSEPKVVAGIHPPIVQRDVWEKVQEMMRHSVHSCVPAKRELTNPLAGVLHCSVCGRSMLRLKDRRAPGAHRLMCPTPGCPTVSHRLDEVEDALLDSIQLWLTDYQLQCKAVNAAERTDDERQAEEAVRRLQRNVNTLREQQGRLYDLLEQGIYSNEIFLERSRILAEKIAAAQQAVADAETAAEQRAAAMRLRRNIVPSMEHVLQVYHSQGSPEERNRLLKQVLDKVVYQKLPTDDRFHLYLFPRFE